MAAPNMKSPTSIVGKTAKVNLTTNTITTVLANGNSSGKVLKINSVYLSNIDATNTATISLSVYNGSTDFYIIKSLNIPIKASQIVLTKESYIYLEENDSLRAIAGAANTVDVIIGYEEIS